jgi:hypothetical protein
MEKRRLLKWISRSSAGILTVLFLIAMTGCTSSVKAPEAERVLIIGIDNLGTDALQFARTPNLNALIREGALSLKARGVMPTVSQPNWCSMLTGAGPEQHGVTSNAWLQDNATIEPTARDSAGYFPSIFSELRNQRPDSKTAVFYDWQGLTNILNPNVMNIFLKTKDYKQTIEMAIPYIVKNKPTLALVYIGQPDFTGHDFGFDSEEYYRAVEDADKEIGRLIDALKKAGLYADTHIFVITDHGGLGREHGGESMTELQVPWLLVGPGVLKNRLIEQPINTYDTASTIALLLRLKQPYVWIGRPVLGAFEAYQGDFPKNTNWYLPKPKTSIRTGIYTEPQELSFTVNNDGAEVRYTLDGTEPAESSPLFEKPILLEKSAWVKAASYKAGRRSQTTVTQFLKVLDVKEITLENPPSPRFPGEGAPALVNRKRGILINKNVEWLGFERTDLAAVLDLGEPKPFNRISLEFLRNQGACLFLPSSIEYAISDDGIEFKTIAVLDRKFNVTRSDGIKLISKDIGMQKARYIKVTAKNENECTGRHYGAGNNPWLFVDEIFVE